MARLSHALALSRDYVGYFAGVVKGGRVSMASFRRIFRGR
jgi:hypothetical protein